MAASIRPRFALLALFAAAPRAGAAGRSDSGDPRGPVGGCAARRRRLCRSGGDQTRHLFPAARARAATADEITDFMAQSPDWPNQALLERRRQEAIAADPDLASTLAQCERNSLTLPQTMLHCAEALANAGRNAEAAEEARRAWVAGIGDERPRFLRRWSGAVRPDDQLGALPAPGPARSGRGGATGPAPGSAAPRRGGGAAGPAARRPERGRTARRACPTRCGAIPA